jgi:hypothetical protein
MKSIGIELAARRPITAEECMKKTALLLFVLLCAAPAFAQTISYPTNVWFPHVDIGGDPNGLHYVTLVQASNNTSSFTVGTMVVYSDAGTQMSASFDGGAPTTSLQFTLDSGAVRQIQVSLSGAITAGWIQITYGPAPAQTNVVLQYLSGSSVLTEVGIDPFFGQMSQTYFPVETSTSLNTGIAIANPNVAAAVMVQLTDPNSGNLLSSTTLSLPANGHTAKLLTDLFPSITNINQMRTILTLISCSTTACTAAGPGFIATALRLNLSSNSFTVVPVVQASNTGTIVRVLPHIAFGGNPSGVNFQTTLYLTTFSGFTSSGTPANLSGVTGQASMFNDSGNPIAASANGGAASSSFTFSVLSNRVTRIVLTGTSTLQAGWIQITLPSTSTALVVNAVFQTYQGTTLTSEASVLEAVQDTEGMMFVNVQPGVTNIGVALANPQTTSNSITLTLYNSAGFAAGTQTFTLAPGGHLAQYVTDMFPQLAGTSFSGTLSMQSAASFSSVALRQNGSNSAGGVPGFAVLTVGDSLMYVPSITNLQITGTNRTTGQVNFTITVADFSASLVTPTAAGVFGEAAIIFANTSVQADDQTFTLDGSSMANATTGTLSGTFTSAHTNIPSGTQATFEIYITDAAGNFSNVIGLPFKF